MPRLLAAGHVTWDRRNERDVLGGSVSYAAQTALHLGWQAGVLTAAGEDFDAQRDLPGVMVARSRSARTTRFANEYGKGGARQQIVLARAEDVDLTPLPDEWRSVEALLLCPVAGELGLVPATAFEAEVVGAIGQGWLRHVGSDGRVSAREWPSVRADLVGVHVLFLSEHDLPRGGAGVRPLLEHVPLVLLTRGWRGAILHTREGSHEIAAVPRPEVDPTGAGDVFAAAFLMRYHEAGDPLVAGAFAACAASFVVEAEGATRLGDRTEIEARLAQRERLIEGEEEWEE